MMFRLIEARCNAIRSRSPLVAPKSPGSSPLSAGSRCCAFTKAHLCCPSAVASEPISRSCWRGWRPQPGDQGEDIREHLSRHDNLGHLEGDVPAVADDLRTD